MKTLCSCRPVYSHKDPDMLLKDHLYRVAEFSLKEIQNARPDCSIPYEALEGIIRIIALTHDLGKATSFFQEYLAYGTCRNDKLRCHAQLSSIFTLYFTEQYLESSGINGSLNETGRLFLKAAAYAAVLKHHGELCNFDSLMDKDDYEDKIDILIRQMEGFYAIHVIDILKSAPFDFFGSFNYDNMVENVLSCYKRNSKKYSFQWSLLDESTFNTGHYLLALMLFSILISSDKHEAIFHRDIEYRSPGMDGSSVDRFKKSLDNSGRMGELRESIYNEVMDSIKDFDPHRRIYSITSPTGTGKTLMALSLALKIRQKLGRQSRIIYCLPFTSIIDQNFEVIKDVFYASSGEYPDSAQLLKHHYLADVNYISKSDKPGKDMDRYETSESKFLMENWKSNFVVTTFVQFFESIFSNKNNKLLKFHSMANSIILLDEIQAIPARYYGAVNEIMKYMAGMFNIYFVLITATQPLIFDSSRNETYELLPDYEKYYRTLSRVNMVLDIGRGLTLEEFCTEVGKILEKNPGKSILIVLNTINSARYIFENIKIKKPAGYGLYYLSTHIVPRDRRKIISRIKSKSKSMKGKLGEHKAKIIVSTQLVEAGVDIDVDIVIRDLGPLDSINQVAGRCNRNWKSSGTVYIYNIKEKGRNLHSYVYDEVNISCTERILQGYSTVSESDFLNLCSRYFSQIKQFTSDQPSLMLKKLISALMFENVEKNFKLIDEDSGTQEKVSIFIEKDKRAVNLWNKYLSILSIEDVYERKKQYLTVKNKLSDYIISVRKNKVLFGCAHPILKVDFNKLDEYYNKQTGFITDGKNTDPGNENILF